jgi:hypothetical protein
MQKLKIYIDYFNNFSLHMSIPLSVSFLVWIQITTLFVILFIVDTYALTLLFWTQWLVLIIKLYFQQNWTSHPTTRFVLFSILRDFNFSDFKGKSSQGGFPATLVKRVTSGKHSDSWIVSFWLQQQPGYETTRSYLNARDLFRSPQG